MRTVYAWLLAIFVTVIGYLAQTTTSIIYSALNESGALNLGSGVVSQGGEQGLEYLSTGIDYLWLFVAGGFWLYAIATTFRREEEVYYE